MPELDYYVRGLEITKNLVLNNKYEKSVNGEMFS